MKIENQIRPLTVEMLRKIKGFEKICDKDSKYILDSIRQLAVTFFKLKVKSMAKVHHINDNQLVVAQKLRKAS